MRLLPARSIAINPNIALRLLAFIRLHMSGRALIAVANMADVEKSDKQADEPAFTQTASNSARRVVAISSAGRQSAGLFGKPGDLRGMGRMTVEVSVARTNPISIRQTRPGFAHSPANASNRIVIIR